MLKRYLVFAGNVYYAEGGWDDFVGDFDDAHEANACAIAEAKRFDLKVSPGSDGWSHIVDTQARELAASYHYIDGRLQKTSSKPLEIAPCSADPS